ncbi:MAG: hypothetical protein M1838_004566 [Thelocarpon superellum]|nr:MAG: hypothetical protein M1838_004566 [Thelocarpon superellum]
MDFTSAVQERSSEPVESGAAGDGQTHSRNPSFSRRNPSQPAPPKSALLNQHLQQVADGHDFGSSFASSFLSSPFRTPPTSPRSSGPREFLYPDSVASTDLSGRPVGTSVENGETCPSCSLSLPKRVSEHLPEGVPGSPAKDGRGKNGSPVLRTREAYISSGIGEDGDATHPLDRARSHPRASLDPEDERPSSSSTTSATTPEHSRSSTMTTSSVPSPHAHTLTYISARQPASRDAHSMLRRSCIRTLSCEQLPRANKGPLFFGDDCAGYTISYVFRLADPAARGRSRRYAFVCWAGREERRAARAWKEVISVFEGMANRIEAMVERQQEGVVRASDGGLAVGSQNSGRDITPVSSFLSGRTVDPDGYPRRASVRARGLAELVGREDFFVEVHAVFVHLLTRLGRVFGGGPAGLVLDSGIRGEVGEVDRDVDPERPRRGRTGAGEPQDAEPSSQAPAPAPAPARANSGKMENKHPLLRSDGRVGTSPTSASASASSLGLNLNDGPGGSSNNSSSARLEAGLRQQLVV